MRSRISNHRISVIKLTWSSVLLFICSSIGRSPGLAQSQNLAQALEETVTGQKKHGTLKGKIVDAVSGAVLNKTTVALRPLESRLEIEPLSTKTNDAGEYEFRQVVPGKYSVMAYRNGYLVQLYGQKDPLNVASDSAKLPTGSPVVVRPGETIDRIDIQLVRGGVVEGCV